MALDCRRRPFFLGQHLVPGVRGAQGVEDGCRDALGPQLHLKRHATPRRVAVPLVDPPARESQVIDEPDAGEAFQGGRDDGIRGTSPTQSLLDFPA
jgi:hypothetical protein